MTKMPAWRFCPASSATNSSRPMEFILVQPPSLSSRAAAHEMGHKEFLTWEELEPGT